MNKIIIQCNTFLRPDDFNNLDEKLKKSFVEGCLVLPAYCELKAIVDAEEVEIIEKE